MSYVIAFDMEVRIMSFYLKLTNIYQNKQFYHTKYDLLYGREALEKYFKEGHSWENDMNISTTYYVWNS